VSDRCGCLVVASCLDSEDMNEAMMVWTLGLGFEGRRLLSFCNGWASGTGLGMALCKEDHEANSAIICWLTNFDHFAGSFFVLIIFGARHNTEPCRSHCVVQCRILVCLDYRCVCCFEPCLPANN